MKGRKGEAVVEDDEYIRHGTTFEELRKSRPVFDKEGTVTAGNASGINNGAAMVVLMNEEEAARRGLIPLGRIASWATAECRPTNHGNRPNPGCTHGPKKGGWSVSDLDLVEANEAFTAQACAVNNDMSWNRDIVNVNGGAIAIGHPVGASGARIFNTLIHEMKQRSAKKGLATLCIGGGMGVAMCVECSRYVVSGSGHDLESCGRGARQKIVDLDGVGDPSVDIADGLHIVEFRGFDEYAKNPRLS